VTASQPVEATRRSRYMSAPDGTRQMKNLKLRSEFWLPAGCRKSSRWGIRPAGGHWNSLWI